MAGKIIMEVCVDSVESAKQAQVGGASRVELCANLLEGGTTPSLGMFHCVKKAIEIPVFVIIRPRGGDFLYSSQEREVMKEDIRLFKEAGADGVVIGALTVQGRVDKSLTTELMSLARPLPVTFHRAFDMTVDLPQALEDIVALGIERILTSGGESTCLEGLPMLARLVQEAAGRVIIVPGGGITVKNLERIIAGCKAVEFHASCRSGAMQSSMKYRNGSVTMGGSFGPPEFSYKLCDSATVVTMLDIARTA